MNLDIKQSKTSLNIVKLKIDEYFDDLVNNIDIKAEKLLAKYQNKFGREAKKKLVYVESLRKQFLDELNKCRQVNFDYLQSLKDQEFEVYLHNALDKNEKLNEEHCFVQNCFIIEEAENPNFSICCQFGFLIIIDRKYVEECNLNSYYDFFTGFRRTTVEIEEMIDLEIKLSQICTKKAKREYNPKRDQLKYFNDKKNVIRFEIENLSSIFFKKKFNQKKTLKPFLKLISIQKDSLTVTKLFSIKL